MKSFAAICLISAVMAGSCNHNEQSNVLGPMQCYSNDECQGSRICKQGWCKGKHFCTGLFADDQGFKYDTVVLETTA